MTDSAEKSVVMIVDDEEMVLMSIRSFLNLETSYEVLTFTSPLKALDHFAQHEVDLVMSDYLMPEMDGISFLAKVRDLRPDVPRIILTGYTGKENAIKAINEVGLYQYIEKPWNNEDLQIILRNSLKKRQLISKLTQKIAEINRAHGELQGLHREIVKAFV